MSLSQQELNQFNGDQLLEVQRLRDGHIAAMGSNVAERRKIVTQMVGQTRQQLRARVNILAVAGGRVRWAPENDYTLQEQEAIQDGLKPGDRWLFRAPEIVSEGLSLKQRVTALESG